MEIGNLGERELTRYRSDKIGFVFQQFHLVPYLTALENVMLAQYFHSITDENEAAEAVRRVGLGDRLEHLPTPLVCSPRSRDPPERGGTRASGKNHRALPGGRGRFRPRAGADLDLRGER